MRVVVTSSSGICWSRELAASSTRCTVMLAAGLDGQRGEQGQVSLQW